MPDASRPEPALPVAIIGAGPVGLAAAAHLLRRGLPAVVLEAGPDAGHAVRQWGHVRMFSPWRYNIDAAARDLLAARGWREPDLDTHPTGGALVADYVQPLATALQDAGLPLRFGARVIGVARRHHDLLADGDRNGALAGPGRAAAPFVLHIAQADGSEQALAARAVIDCSGTWFHPSPAGAHGLPALGERQQAGRIAFGIPDVLGDARAAHAGRHVMVVGAGHSAMNAVLDLVALADQAPGTRITWVFRRPMQAVNFGGGGADQLAARGALGAQAQALVTSGKVQALAPFAIHRIDRAGDGLLVQGEADGVPQTHAVDRLIVATGLRPDLSLLGELRLDLDHAVQATPALAPLIDPNLHSCGTVRPHGEAELRHAAEPGFYIAGMKAYGRAPTFLLATGHEQVRSIAAYLAGDLRAARRVELVLPETGVCSSTPAAGGCCAPAEPAASSCCAPKPEPAASTCCAPKPEPVVAGGCCGGETTR